MSKSLDMLSKGINKEKIKRGTWNKIRKKLGKFKSTIEVREFLSICQVDLSRDSDKGSSITSDPSIESPQVSFDSEGGDKVQKANEDVEMETPRFIWSYGIKWFSSIEVRGYDGGIAMGWKEDMVHIHILKLHFQYIHVLVRTKDGLNWNLTMVYASPREARARGEGGYVDASRRNYRNFQDRINTFSHMDLGSISYKYTWRGLIGQGGLHWLDYSDHHLICIHLLDKELSRRNRDFRPSRSKMLSGIRTALRSLTRRRIGFSGESKGLKKYHGGGDHAELRKLERILQNKLDKLLYQEALMWF
ncbi:hypothetical protein KIW84_045364 [Lathyrus oleraceus]|uniref:Uncharacterized protein n=1 Tax=Pisum sativum TaxID=3888 RepID=A0A9D4XKJ0_PEA|nr:hypothetical protein KIW84_045363 [Pisum sativum]KAI5421887.1 hypothetical protein KIW84_045364 [Pisum sativum]